MKKLSRVASWLVSLNRITKQSIMIVSDLIALSLLVGVAFSLRLGTLILPPFVNSWMLVSIPLLSVSVLYFFGFYRSITRYIGADIIRSVFVSVSLICLLVSAIMFMSPASSAPRSVVLIFGILALLYLLSSRYLVRNLLEHLLSAHSAHVPVAIYGAGSCGMQLALALSQGSIYDTRLFVDDDKRLQGTTILGKHVVSPLGLASVLKKQKIDTILLAMPSVSRHRRMEIVQALDPLNVKVKSVPALPDVVVGRVRIEDVHDVDIEDLLGRDCVPPDEMLLAASVVGRCVMVTGAGGSIGSELCRQIVAQKPSKLVLFERGEFELYDIEKQLKEWLLDKGQQTQLVPVLGSVTNEAQVELVCREHKVKTLFHAAAYKHVPIVEANPLEGIENNIFGTYRTAIAAQGAGVERFVLISTDKAVRPTNVMGATKRFAELILQALAEQTTNTVFTMVRFGNVLGSSGSVVPLFRKQILAGGPVTLTHSDITRYFMTIPEASQLVIQAGAMAEGGEVFVLDMGEPIKIYDLAVSMIQLMGFSLKDETNPAGEIEIKITGLRPGEKLYEELLIGSDSAPTRHSMIMKAQEVKLSLDEVESLLSALAGFIQTRNVNSAVSLLRQSIHGYHVEAADTKVVALRQRGNHDG